MNWMHFYGFWRIQVWPNASWQQNGKFRDGTTFSDGRRSIHSNAPITWSRNGESSICEENAACNRNYNPCQRCNIQQGLLNYGSTGNVSQNPKNIKNCENVSEFAEEHFNSDGNKGGVSPDVKRKRKYIITRTDVPKKCILRALRKEYCDSFSMFAEMNGYVEGTNEEEFYSHMKSYAEYLKKLSKEEEKGGDVGELTELPFVLGLLINFCKMKRLPKSKPQKEMQCLFHEVLYKYSHTKFDKLLLFPEMQFLFLKILTEEFLEGFLMRHQTLIRQKAKAEKCARDIIQTCQISQRIEGGKESK